MCFCKGMTCISKMCFRIAAGPLLSSNPQSFRPLYGIMGMIYETGTSQRVSSVTMRPNLISSCVKDLQIKQPFDNLRIEQANAGVAARLN